MAFFGEQKRIKKLIITVVFAIWGAQKYEKAYNYCGFCNFRG